MGTLKNLREWTVLYHVGGKRLRQKKGKVGATLAAQSQGSRIIETAGMPVWKARSFDMRISDAEVRKILMGGDSLVQDIEEISLEGALSGRDKELIQSVVAEVVAMPDRDDVVAELKARVEAGTYHPTGSEIAETMIRRAIADRVR